MKNNLTSFAAITTLTLLCFAAPLAIVSGCKTGPAKTVYQVSGTAKVSVDSAMRAWGAYVSQFNPPVAQEQAVKDAFGKYQTAQLAVLDAAIAYQTAKNDGDAAGQSTAQATMNAAIAAAGAALSDLTSLIVSFGVKIQPPMP